MQKRAEGRTRRLWWRAAPAAFFAAALAGCATVPDDGVLVVPGTSAGAPRPLVYLRVDASRRPTDGKDREREQDVALSLEFRQALIERAQGEKLVSGVLTDPLDLSRADYQVTLVLDEQTFDEKKAEPWPGVPETFVENEDFWLPIRHYGGLAYRARFTVRDRRGRALAFPARADAADGGAGPVRPAVRWRYKDASDHMALRVLALLAASPVFRPLPASPPTKARAVKPVAPPGAVVAPLRATGTSPPKPSTPAVKEKAP